MLAQFQARYPTASLLSQLLTIYQGRFIVQVSVQIENVIRATGIAAAETVELAEDKARLRAISLISTPEITPSVQVTSPQEGDLVPAISELTAPISVTNLSNSERSFAPTSPPDLDDYPEFAPISSKDYSAPPELNSDLVIEEFGIETISPATNNPVASFNNVTPFISPTFTPESPINDSIEPIDLSDTLIAIETELRNLRWTAEQERKYINRIYKKASRDLLSTEQLFEFLNYLQVFAQTGKELERLGWNNQQGQDYLMENYKVRSRQYLSYQELKDFFQHLQATS
ncbi:hypothetical protein [Chlorogloea sp. CCALA 695]|uniref:hypothetical protein n=1 Tax=Chlorogloea sp. CCALA 695 TaxID=2107693 RepID=UPI000D04FFF1|nr:hypothetical protein [Chlorogloea sp. CCALA 695]PSB32780.1 hypothetical protein C7B70_09650 [Chlorogloea sp. CCALA 695]